MTKEEAIELLKEYATRIKPFYEPKRTNYAQAIDMAIESLSAEIKVKNELLYKIQSEFEAEEARAFADQTKGLKEHAVWNKAIRILEEYIV